MGDCIQLTPLKKEISKLEILQRLKCLDNDLVFLSGSLVEGLGNSYSDLDVFVLCNELANVSEFTYNFENLRMDFAKINGINCDIEYWSLQLVNEIIEQINQIDFSESNVRVLNELKINGVFTDITSLIHRLLVGIPIKQESAVQQLVEKLDKEKFYRLMIRFYINIVDNQYEDVMGNLLAGEYETAVIIGRELIIHVIMAYLFSKNISIDRTKWIYPKLRQIAEQDPQGMTILKQLNRLWFACSMQTPESMKSNAETILTFSNKTIATIEKNIGGL